MHTGTYGMINNNFFINPKIQKSKTKIAIEHANIVGLERSNVTFFGAKLYFCCKFINQ